MALEAKDFSWTQRVLTDAKGDRIIVFICEGPKNALEAVVISMNIYGDRTISGYRSLKEFGTGRISGSQMAFSVLPAWAQSQFSSEPQEILQNQVFVRFLIEQGILTKDHHLTRAYSDRPASILFYFTDMKQEPDATQAHENSHVFYNNLSSYKNAATRVFMSLSQQQRQCVEGFLKKKAMYDVNDKDVLIDEFMAYDVEGYKGLKLCFSALGADINQDGAVSEDEQYLWQTSRP